MTMRRLLLCALLLAVGCGSSSASLHESSAPPDPRELLGTWDVSGEGVPSGTRVTFSDSSSVDAAFSVQQPCGRVGGSWRAAQEQPLLVAGVSAGDGGCFGPKGIEGVAWLRQVLGFRIPETGPELLGDAGQVVATLNRVGTAPTASPSAGLGEEFAVPLPLPEGAEAPTEQQLRGQWVPVDPTPTKPFAEFDDDHGWHGSDGCNSHGGQFVLGKDGRLLATSGVSTLIGCMGSALPHWVAQAGRVGLVGAELVFYDPKGKELGRARR